MIQAKYEKFFEELGRDDEGVARFDAAFGRDNIVIEQHYDENDQFCMRVLLNIFQLTSDGHIDQKNPEIISYIENPEPEIVITASPSVRDVAPAILLNDAAVILPAIVRLGEERYNRIRIVQEQIREGALNV